MEIRYICINPFEDTVEKECDRYPHDTCCMCTGPMIAFELNDIKDLLQTLKDDGINSKQKVIDILTKIKDAIDWLNGDIGIDDYLERTKSHA